MAKLYPKREEILNNRQKPTEGELYLVDKLNEILDDSYEIYFQPYLNGDHPDIIVMRKNGGILIIEVKDWNLSSYELNNSGEMILRCNNHEIKTPMEQVKAYRRNLMNFHIPGFLDYSLYDSLYEKNYEKTVNTAVYFHNETENSIKMFFSKSKERNVALFGRNSLNNNSLYNFVNKVMNSTRNAIYFKEKLYLEARRLFQPSYQLVYDKKKIKFTSKQERLTLSKECKTKIKGVAGSGKTLILAERAVNAYERTKGKVLIVTFNITLRNYIMERLNAVLGQRGINVPAKSIFTVLNYHLLLKLTCNNVGIDINDKYIDDNNYRYDLKRLKKFEDSIEKYNTILVDEVQDFEEQWLEILEDVFLEEHGEFVILGDDKQNIYKRKTDKDNLPKTRIKGKWNVLNESFRLSGKIVRLAQKFQRNFWELNKVDNIEEHFVSNLLEFEENIKYKYIDNGDACDNVDEIIDYSLDFIKDNNINSNDVAILSNKIENIREIEYRLRKSHNINVERIFETKEQFEELCRKIFLKNNFDEKRAKKELDEELTKIRKSRKYNFYMNSGKMKLSSTHSFKGWEIHTLILVIDDCKNVKPELVYTSITRAIKNLIVINLGNKKQHKFFENAIENI